MNLYARKPTFFYFYIINLNFMELLYIWVNRYRTISKQGFNFGGKYKFDFDFDSGELFLDENPNYTSDFFGNKISNVTAIIGANGSGKSTFLDFIKLNIATDIGVTNLNYIALFRVKGREKIFVYNSLNKAVRIPAGKEAMFENALRGTIDGKLVSLLFPTAFIFYSPILDFNFEHETTPIDLSTSSIIRNTEPIENSRHSLFDDITLLEIKKQLQFVSKYQGLLPFGMPEELCMNPHRLDIDVILAKIESETDIASHLLHYKKIIEKEKHDKRDRATEYGICEIYEALFWQIINFSQVKQNLFTKTIEIPFLNLTLPFEPKTDKPTKEIVLELFKNLPLENESLPKMKEFQKFSSLLEGLLEKEDMDYFFARFNLEVGNPEKFKRVDEFLDSYYKISIVGDFVTLDWGLSSGEQSYLIMFARFYEGRARIRKYMDEINTNRTRSHGMPEYDEIPDVVVMIDEGETSFHPQWQKEFLYNLCNFLPEILDVPKIQLILASNSPFLISDLPKSNITFVEKEGRSTKVIDRKLSSFAANIHDLLAHDFFLDTPIGRFAEEKIKKAIEMLKQSDKLDKEKTDDLLKLIKIVDDPIVRNKLLQMYSLKTGGEEWEENLLIQQQQIIERKLKELRKK